MTTESVERAVWARHRRYCFRCADGKPCEQPSHQERRDVEVILAAYTDASDRCTCGEFDCEACIENGVTDDASAPASPKGEVSS